MKNGDIRNDSTRKCTIKPTYIVILNTPPNFTEKSSMIILFCPPFSVTFLHVRLGLVLKEIHSTYEHRKYICANNKIISKIDLQIWDICNLLIHTNIYIYIYINIYSIMKQKNYLQFLRKLLISFQHRTMITLEKLVSRPLQFSNKELVRWHRN